MSDRIETETFLNYYVHDQKIKWCGLATTNKQNGCHPRQQLKPYRHRSFGLILLFVDSSSCHHHHHLAASHFLHCCCYLYLYFIAIAIVVAFLVGVILISSCQDWHQHRHCVHIDAPCVLVHVLQHRLVAQGFSWYQELVGAVNAARPTCKFLLRCRCKINGVCKLYRSKRGRASKGLQQDCGRQPPQANKMWHPWL